MELKNRSFVLIDIESTGLNKNEHQILEVGLLVIKDLSVVSELNVKIKHDNYVISPKAMEINKINLEEHKKDAIFEKEACDAILNFLNDNKTIGDEKGFIVIGQNVNFDLGFLEVMFKRNNLIKEYRSVISYRQLDLMQLALIKNLEGKVALESQSLDCILKALSMEIPECRHSALGDCKLTYEAFIKLLKM